MSLQKEAASHDFFSTEPWDLQEQNRKWKIRFYAIKLKTKAEKKKNNNSFFIIPSTGSKSNLFLIAWNVMAEAGIEKSTSHNQHLVDGQKDAQHVFRY